MDGTGALRARRKEPQNGTGALRRTRRKAKNSAHQSAIRVAQMVTPGKTQIGGPVYTSILL